MTYIVHPKPKWDGQENVAGTWTSSQRSTSHTAQPGNSEGDMKTALLVLGVNDGPHPGPMRERDDFLKTTRRPVALQREQGRANVYIPKEERERQKPFNETLRVDLEWHWSQASSSSSSQW